MTKQILLMFLLVVLALSPFLLIRAATTNANPDISVLSFEAKRSLMISILQQLIAAIKELIQLKLDQLLHPVIDKTATSPLTSPSDFALPVTAMLGNSCSSISQYGITWTFDKAYTCGQYVNGDWWVVSPAKVIAINPVPRCDGIAARNGSMLNPRYEYGQGYDGRAPAFKDFRCSAPPLTLNPGDSLISSQSWDPKPANSGFTFLKTAAVLTAVDQPQSGDKFRPPYTRPSRLSNSNKDPLLFSFNQLRWNKLPSLAKVANTPAISDTARLFQRVWIDHFDGWEGGRIQPKDNMHDYGRENGMDVSEGSLQLLLDYSREEKKPLLAGFIQYGIDVYGIYLSGGMWDEGAGVSQGRKWPLLFAGIMLGDSEMQSLTFQRTNHYGEKVQAFQEDGQTYYYNDPDLPECATVEGAKVSCGSSGAMPVRGVRGWMDKLNGGDGDFVLWRLKDSNKFGVQEYEHLSISDWSLDKPGNHQYRFDNYRHCCSSQSYVGYALAARLMGSIDVWDHDAFFDYIDRWMTQDDSKAAALYQAKYNESVFSNFRQGQTFSPFVTNMWNRYRGNITPLFEGGEAPTCTESWSCLAWSPCSSDGIQTITCTDNNQCGTINNKPPESQSCTGSEVVIPPAITTELVAHYSFDQDGRDESGNGNNLALVNSPVATPGQMDGAIRFGGVNQYAKASNFDADLNSGATISLWLNYQSSTNLDYFLDSSIDGNVNNRAISIFDASGGIRFQVDDNVPGGAMAYDTLIGEAIPLGVWIHYVFAYDATNLRIYTNGQLTKTVVAGGSGLASPANLTLGANRYNNGATDVVLDEIRIYRGILSVAEVQAL